MRIAYALVVAELAFGVGVVFVSAWRGGDIAAALALGAVLFSMMLVVMVAIRLPA